MRIYLYNQAKNFDTLLSQLEKQQEMRFDKAKLNEKTSLIKIDSQKKWEDIDFGTLLSYQIFPPHIMTFRSQWDREKRAMRTGDTILQQVFIPPIQSFSQKVIFGVRINEVIHEPDRKGFSYVTLEGHVERGESTFTLERRNGGIIFQIKTYSEPGNWLTRLVGPIVTVPYQAYCTREALVNVKKQMERL